MAAQDTTDRGPSDPSSTAYADAMTEGAVLSLLLDEHPARLTIDELSLVLDPGPENGTPNDACERAVRELVGAGLVHRDGCFLMPSRAARYFERLGVS